MADNTTLNQGALGDTIRTIDRSTDAVPVPAKTQVVAIDIGGEAGESLLAPGNLLPVDPNSSVADGTASSAVPQVSVTAGKGTDGLVHSIEVDPQGVQQVREQAATQAQDPTTPLNTVLVGDPNGDFAGMAILDMVVQDATGIGFNVRVINPPKADASGAAVLSDAIPYQINIPAGATYLLDTTGYQSVGITTQTLAANVFATNDLKTLSALSGTPLVLGAYVTAVAAGAGYVFPAAARYVALTATTSGTATIYLRAAPWNASYTTSVPSSVAQNNEAQYGGTTVVTGGVAGLPGVGGNVAPGSARTANPVPVAGADASNLTRTVLTDTAGRVQVGAFGTDFTGAAAALSVQKATNNLVPALQTQDVGGTDGSTLGEVLWQILLEMRVLNQQVYLLNSQGGALDDPASIKADPTINLPLN